MGALSPIRVPSYAMRTYSGRPSCSIRFNTSADETVVMGKLTKAGAMLLADPIMVEHLEMLEWREVKQHHDEQHLRARELAGALPCCLRRDQPVRFPVFEHFAEVIETAIERRRYT